MKRILPIYITLFALLATVLLSCSHSKDFKFALITDTHIGKNETATEDLENTIASINRQPEIAFVLVSGDITEGGDLHSLERAETILNKLKVPYYAIPGNHETKWSESGVTDFKKVFGGERFHFEHKGMHFLGFNSGPVIRMMDGHVGIQDLIWLEQELKANKPDAPVVIVTHYPLQTGDVDNWYEVTDLIRPYNIKAVLGGHYHKNQMTSYDDIPAYINRSNLRGNDPCGGYSVYTVTKDSIRVSEQRNDDSQATPWGGYSLATQYYNVSNAGYPRPDYAVNATYPEVKTEWLVQSDGAIYASPAVSEGNVYVGDDLGRLSCYSITDGSLQWTFQSGSRILGTPAAADNVVVFGSTDHNIYGIDAQKGEALWCISTDKPVIGAVSIDDEGYAYVGGSDGHFRCIDIQDGQERWSYPNVGGYVETRPLVYGDKVIFGAWDSYMYALNRQDGSLAWKWNNGNERMHFSPAAVWPVGAQGKVFFAAPDRVLTALNAKDGTCVWRTKESMVRETVGLSEDRSRIYSKTMQDSVVCYAAAGNTPKRLWAVNVGYGYDHAPSMPVEKDGTVFGSTKNGLIFALDARSGAVKWIHKTGNSLINTVVPLSATRCLFTSAEGCVGIAASPSPSKGGDVRK